MHWAIHATGKSNNSVGTSKKKRHMTHQKERSQKPSNAFHIKPPSALPQWQVRSHSVVKKSAMQAHHQSTPLLSSPSHINPTSFPKQMVFSAPQHAKPLPPPSSHPQSVSKNKSSTPWSINCSVNQKHMM